MLLTNWQKILLRILWMENSFNFGFKSAVENYGGVVGDNFGRNYVNLVDAAISDLENDINAFQGYNTPVDKLQGDIAEFWHARSFNINTAVNQSKYLANINRSHEFASPDISGNWENSDYGLKYYKTAEKTIAAQAKSYIERYKEYHSKHPECSFEKYLSERNVSIDCLPDNPIYSGQLRLIPCDQYKEALLILDLKIASESVKRPELVAKYKEVRELLTKNVKSPDGTTSIELDRKTSQRIAELAREGKFNAADMDITTEKLIHINHMIKSGVKAGISAAVITMVLKTAPEIYKCLDQLINYGSISNEQLEKFGLTAIEGTYDGFLRGFISGVLTIACESGKLGSVSQNIPPGVIGALTVILIQSLKDSMKVVKGELSRVEMLNNLNRSILVSGISIGTASLFQILMPALPFAYLLGNMVGSFVGSYIYETADKAIMALAIENGWTIFGLVEQDYQLPDEVLEEIGIDVFEYEKFLPKEFSYDTFSFDNFNYNQQNFDMIHVLRRGVISVHQVGYIS